MWAENSCPLTMHVKMWNVVQPFRKKREKRIGPPVVCRPLNSFCWHLSRITVLNNRKKISIHLSVPFVRDTGNLNFLPAHVRNFELRRQLCTCNFETWFRCEKNYYLVLLFKALNSEQFESLLFLHSRKITLILVCVDCSQMKFGKNHFLRQMRAVRALVCRLRTVYLKSEKHTHSIHLFAFCDRFAALLLSGSAVLIICPTIRI